MCILLLSRITCRVSIRLYHLLSLSSDGLKNVYEIMRHLAQTTSVHLESSFDGLHGAGAVAGHALEEEEATLLVEDGIGGPCSENMYYIRIRTHSALLILCRLINLPLDPAVYYPLTCRCDT